MADYFRIPFAESGDRNVIPETTPDTEVSLSTGWTTAYAEDPTTSATARRLQRQNFNGLFHTIMTAVQQYQQEGVYDFITSAQNGGSPFAYAQDALVRYENPPGTTRVYRSLADTNTDLPSVTTSWAPIDALNPGALTTLLRLLLTATDAIDLTDTNNALNIGASDPTANPHLALSLNQLQAKATQTTTATLNIQSLGGVANIGAQSGTGTVSLYANGAETFEAEGPGSVAIHGDADNDTDIRSLNIRQLDGTIRGRLGHQGSPVLELRNFVAGANLLLAARNAATNDQSLLEGDPDGALTGFHAGVERWNTRDDGINVRGSVAPAIGGTQDSYVQLQDSNGATIADLGFITSAELILINRNNGGNVALQAANAAGTTRTLLLGNPDGVLTGYHEGNPVTRTAAAASGGLQANNTLTGAGFERVLTTSDIPTTFGIKTANTQRTDTATPAIDADFSIVINAADIGRYRINGQVWYDSGLGGIQLQVNYTGTSDSENVTYLASRSGIAQPIFAANLGDNFSISGTTSRDSIDISGTFEATASGTLRVFWSQQSLSGTPTTVNENSYLRIERIS